jgi:hypothetical protein
MAHLNKADYQGHLANHLLPRLEKMLLTLSFVDSKPISIAGLKSIAIENGLRECAKWNIADILGKSKGFAIKTKEGWSLTTKGVAYLISENLITERKSISQTAVDDLRMHLSAIKDANTKEYLEEAVSCLEAGQNRAAIVFSWVGAISILHLYVVNNKLIDFNAEATRRDSKWKTAKTTDEIGLMKEAVFLDVLQSISVIGKNVKQELQTALTLRNGCGHPNSLKVGERKAAAHIETLIQNVFSRF